MSKAIPPPSVRILPESVVNKIAAGEVVERPASVVKELMENSLDAGAAAVTVRLKGSPGNLISVSDDGCGLSPDDALLALERHSTSKIASVEDIEAIRTRGFRGEALPSIAGVSRFTLETRRASLEAGVRVEVTGGTVRSCRAVARPPGTTVTVSGLFFNTPARRKFQRSAPTERSHVVRVFLTQALANPEVRMELETDGRVQYLLPPGSLEKRLRGIFGNEALQGFVPVDAGADGGEMRLTGFVVDPAGRKPGAHQYFFVNGRPVEDRLLQAAVREGVSRGGGAVPRPACFLFLAVDPAAVDVNVHPAKREVRFSVPSRVMSFVSSAVASALARADHRPEPPPAGLPPPRMPAASRAAETAAMELPAAEAREISYGEPSARHPVQGAEGITCLGQVLNGYIVAEREGRLLLVDQHAAHERVIFERVLSRLDSGGEASQSLLWPEILELPPDRFRLVQELLPALERAGLKLEPFGPSAFRVLASPPEVPSQAVGAFIEDLVSLGEEVGELVERAPDWRQRAAALVACHGAVKSGDRLTDADMERLLGDLLACRDPGRCPHGRPTMVTLGLADLERMFHRR